MDKLQAGSYAPFSGKAIGLMNACSEVYKEGRSYEVVVYVVVFIVPFVRVANSTT